MEHSCGLFYGCHELFVAALAYIVTGVTWTSGLSCSLFLLLQKLNVLRMAPGASTSNGMAPVETFDGTMPMPPLGVGSTMEGGVAKDSYGDSISMVGNVTNGKDLAQPTQT